MAYSRATLSGLALSSLLSVGLLGCGALDNGSSPTPTPGTGTDTPTPTPDGSTSIYDINQGGAFDGDVLTIRGIVTAMNYNNDFWVSDPAGGEYSGLYIFDEYEEKGVAAGIKIGDAVEVLGVFQLFNGVRELVVYADDGAVTLTQADAGLPEPVTLTTLEALAVADHCDADVTAALEPYMNAYLSLPETTVSSAAGACGTDPKYGTFELEDAQGNQVLGDDDTDPAYEPVEGDIIQVNGVLFFSNYSDVGNYKILPTQIEVIEGEVPTPTPTPDPDLTIQELNQGAVADEGLAAVSGIVTAIDAAGNFWIQDAAGGAWAGIYVYDKNAKGKTAGIERGDLVRVTGVFEADYYGLRELKIYQEDAQGFVAIEQKGAGMPSPEVIGTLSDLGISTYCKTDNVTDAEPYVGLYVKLPGVTVSDAMACDPGTDPKLWEVKDSKQTPFIVYSGKWNLSYTPVVGDTLDLTGVMSYSFEKYELLPPSNEEVAVQ